MGVVRGFAGGLIRSIDPRLGRLAVCDHVRRGTVRYVMVSLVVPAYTDIIECG